MSGDAWNIKAELEELKTQGLWRQLRVAGEEPGLTNFSSNDYLGLAASEPLKAALREGVERYGAGSGASRLVCGTWRPHVELEDALARFKTTEAALAFSSGYAVPMGIIPALSGQGDTVILDKLCHASLVDAARLSGATIRVFPHNHLDKLERLLATAKGRVLVVTESIFSMDGDASALAEIIALKDRRGAWLMVDEAHAVGVLGPGGRGLAAQLGLEARIELQMGTLSKAIGLSGGYVAASRDVIDLLINRARSFIYSTAPSPALAFAAKAALELVASTEGDRRRERLRQSVQSLAHALGKPPPPAAILPLIIGDEAAAMEASSRLRDLGFLIPAIRYPTVARGSARLRITLSAAHTMAEIEALASALKTIISPT